MDMQFLNRAFEALPAPIRRATPCRAFVLGSGWSRAMDGMEILGECSYADIPGLGRPEVVGHDGRLLLAHLPECPSKPFLAFCGRRHWYEGVGWEPVILPVDVCRRLKVSELLITNAAGGIRNSLKPGDIVVIRDHLRISHLNPLRGPHYPEYGPRFPDQSQVYDPRLIDRLQRAAVDAGITLAEGVYAFSGGPSYETPAEIRAYGFLGGDVVGMSTVPEAIVASAAGLRVAALSLVTNMAAGIGGRHLAHDDVIDVANASAERLSGLLRAYLAHQDCSGT